MHIQILDERRIDVHGEDAREWLNGQLTCDLRRVSPGAATYGLILSSKGKLISDVWVLEHEEEDDVQRFSLSVPAVATDVALERLLRFLVMEDVDVCVSDERVISLQGTGARRALREHDRVWPVTRLDTEGAEVWLGASDAEALLTQLQATPAAAFEDARIEAGVPALGKDMGDSTLPQEIGLHAAVSFNKGCYVGQEPVVMLEHRGKPPKRLVQLHVNGVTVGDVVLSGKKDVGRITSAHSSQPLALALIKRKHLEDSLKVGESEVKLLTIIDDGKPRDRNA